MNNLHSQHGVGLIEVMVALLLLAVAILGFSAMQLSAIKATDESLVRTQSISTIKTLSESMRILPNSSSTYRTEVNKIYQSNRSSENEFNVGSYCESVDTYNTTASNCTTSNCSVEQVVKYSVASVLKAACAKEIALNIEKCPDTSGVNERQCIIASWNRTKPTMQEEKYSCTNAKGSYKPSASCFIMEAY